MFSRMLPNKLIMADQGFPNILSRATYPGAPSYGGMRTWVESSQAREDRALAETCRVKYGPLFFTSICELLYRLYFYQNNTAVEH